MKDVIYCSYLLYANEPTGDDDGGPICTNKIAIDLGSISSVGNALVVPESCWLSWKLRAESRKRSR